MSIDVSVSESVSEMREYSGTSSHVSRLGLSLWASLQLNLRGLEHLRVYKRDELSA